MSEIDNKININIDESLENTYKDLFNGDNEVLNNLFGGFDMFESLLNMPDDQFEELAPSFYQIFLEVLERQDTRGEIQLLISKGQILPDELEKEADLFYTAIDEIEDISDIKKTFIKRLIVLFTNTISQCIGFDFVQIPCELSENVNLPQYANEGDAGLDIYSPAEYTIAPGETVIIPTGIKVAIPKGYAILIQPRSGQSVKTKLRIANTPGLIDSGYRDEIGVIVENIEPQFKDIDYEFDSEGNIQINSIEHGKAYTIAEGQRFAQMRLVQVPTASFVQVESVKDIGEDRGGGFGHTGQ